MGKHIKHILRAAALLAAGALFLFIAQTIVSSIAYEESDFFSFWLAGRMTLTHEDPYAADLWISQHHVYRAEWISDSTFLYPLPLALFFTPWGAMPLYHAYILWVWLSQVMLVICAAILLSLFGANRRKYILPLAMGILVFRPIISLLLNGQIGAFLLLAIVTASLLLEREQWILGGAVLSLTLLKPNLGVLLLALSGGYFLIRGHYRALVGMALASAGMFAAAFLYDSHWVWKYLTVMQTKGTQTFGFSPTIWGLSAYISGFNLQKTIWLGGIVTALLLTIYLVMIYRWKNISPLAGVGFATALTALLTPYLWTYDQIILILPIVILMAILKDSYLQSALIFIAVDAAGMGLLWVSAQSRMENINGLLPLLITALYVAVLYMRRPVPTFSIEVELLS